MGASIVIGAGGGIGGALVERLAARPDGGPVLALSRTRPDALPPGVSWGEIDLGEESSIAAAVAAIDPNTPVDRVLVATGRLQVLGRPPEKSWRHLEVEGLMAAFAYRRGRLAALLRHLRRDGAAYLVSRMHLRLRSSRAWRRLWRILHRAGAASLSPEETFRQMTDDLDALALAYEPRSYSGPVLIVRSESIPVGPALDPMLGWRAFAGNGETVSVPGFDHEGAFSATGCRVMAAKISLMALR